MLLSLIIPDAMALLLEFQCLMHPAVAIHSVLEFDRIEHNKKDDLMDFNVDCYWNYSAIFITKRNPCWNVISVSQMLLVSGERRGCVPHQLCQFNWEKPSAHTHFIFSRMLHLMLKGQRAFHFHHLSLNQQHQIGFLRLSRKWHKARQKYISKDSECGCCGGGGDM